MMKCKKQLKKQSRPSSYMRSFIKEPAIYLRLSRGNLLDMSPHIQSVPRADPVQRRRRRAHKFFLSLIIAPHLLVQKASDKRWDGSSQQDARPSVSAVGSYQLIHRQLCLSIIVMMLMERR